MTDEQINIAIADACGWDMDPEEAHKWESRGRWVKSPRGQMKFRHAIPDYCNDLNAMHEAEKVFNSWSFWHYADILNRLVPANMGKDSYIRATARQRAEAFLRTLGKWEELE
jgi:hypothetical protein